MKTQTRQKGSGGGSAAANEFHLRIFVGGGGVGQMV